MVLGKQHLSGKGSEAVAEQKLIRGQKDQEKGTPDDSSLLHQSLPNDYAGYYFRNILIR